MGSSSWFSPCSLPSSPLQGDELTASTEPSSRVRAD
jgi:hypothetical protein